MNNEKIKIIKKFQNKKLFDMKSGCYVSLQDIAKMIRNDEEIMVIDNKSKTDITRLILTQIIFESELMESQPISPSLLREIVKNKNGSISSFLTKFSQN